MAKYDILLVVDEVICGFGRTGEWFGTDLYGLEPDLMPIAKGMTSGYMPMGGVIVSDRVSAVLEEKGGEFNHGYTYSGHPVAAAVALENLRIIKEKQLIEYVRDDIGPYLQKRWQSPLRTRWWVKRGASALSGRWNLSKTRPRAPGLTVSLALAVFAGISVLKTAW